MLKHKLPGFIRNLREVMFFNFFINILKFYIFIYTIFFDIFLRNIIFVSKVKNFNLYKVKDSDINKYYDIILMESETETENMKNIFLTIKEKFKNRNLLFYCSVNEIDITEDVRKFINYFDDIKEIPWAHIYEYLISSNKIENDSEKYSILLIDDQFNEININH
jgi:hypothetical protein